MPKHEIVTKAMELIQKSETIINKLIKKEDVIIFIGMTGTGKSTLINYLNGVQLEAFTENNGVTYKLKAKDRTKELPGVEIGHSASVSCTRVPGVYSPSGKSYTHIDMPGFGDTGNLSNDSSKINEKGAAAVPVSTESSSSKNINDNQKNYRDKNENNIGSNESTRVAREIANAYFRKMVTENAKHIKIVLVISHNDLTQRDGSLPKSLKDFTNFIQGIETGDENAISDIADSITIVVTKLSDPTNNLKQELLDLKEGTPTYNRKLNEIKFHQENPTFFEDTAERSLSDFIEQSPALRSIQNMQTILNDVINKRHFAIFTTPFQLGDKPNDEAVKINQVIENTNFVDKAVANLGARISSDASKIIMAIDDLSVLGKSLAERINADITNQLNIAFAADTLRLDTIRSLKKTCEAVKDNKNLQKLTAFFKNIETNLKLSKLTQKEYIKFNKLLTFLVELLPVEERQKYSTMKNWIKELRLDSILNPIISCTTDILNRQKPNIENGKLTIRGFHIKTSQVDESISRYNDVITDIEIQALHTITMDDDLSAESGRSVGKLSGVNLSMIAPHIIVSGNRTIDLSGKNANSHNQIKAANGNNGAAGATVEVATPGNPGLPGSRGTDGVPGLSGTSAGNLFIACDKLVGKKNLNVKLKGGNGANGQEGGNGGNGSDGSGVTWRTDPLPPENEINL